MELEVLTLDDWKQWDAWLARHFDNRAGVWLRIAKKSSGRATVTADEAGEVALCYGWIDSLRRSDDEQYFVQKYSPRRPRAAWSRINVERVERLIEAGRMRAPGLAEVEAARADGRWDAAYESQRTATVPPDLAAALTASPVAEARFAALSKTARYAAILRLLKTRTAASRASLIEKLIASLRSARR
jgi:uncharacterized protein YdeI (YjbR/CyaY-like superfamily)